MKDNFSKELVSFCGLYCGACNKFLKGKCPGCLKNKKASWCQVCLCNLKNSYSSCAHCREFSDVAKCKKYNNFFAKIFGLIFRSDRRAGIERIKKVGRAEFAKEMNEKGQSAIKKID